MAISRSDVTKVLFSGISAGRVPPQTQARVFTLARDHLNEVFGFEMLPTQKMQKTGEVAGGEALPGAKGKAAAAASSGRFVLRNVFPEELTSGLIVPAVRSEQSKMGLLMAVMGIIHLSNGRISEEALFGHLAALGLQLGNSHKTFGDRWENIILKDFVSQRWLHTHKVSSGHKEISFGEKALALSPERDLYIYIAKLFDAPPDPIKLEELEQEQEKRRELQRKMSDEISEKAAEEPKPTRVTRSQSQTPGKRGRPKAQKSDSEDDFEEIFSDEEQFTPAKSKPTRRRRT